ncbi:hypothetical protein CC1G_11459 [Coprinopsis cinerea okayama7|uniref:SET domain-containing protein n=1 Tax=Coprinopsis cinerea (strain Okayama-7 / 130 / ATCC MYA-4618 / FGSC 9003) TaxID=240176 RepID=A8P037_COPC7|nr:hypothetical protein CC1G_11459 [Coprinopsis cinerea okayama7\|eukprot:XP_001837814.1 hypothetical protein CC1G_11459 [Coprinopsis cinerea okayama7\
MATATATVTSREDIKVDTELVVEHIKLLKKVFQDALNENPTICRNEHDYPPSAALERLLCEVLEHDIPSYVEPGCKPSGLLEATIQQIQKHFPERKVAAGQLANWVFLTVVHERLDLWSNVRLRRLMGTHYYRLKGDHPEHEHLLDDDIKRTLGRYNVLGGMDAPKRLIDYVVPYDWGRHVITVVPPLNTDLTGSDPDGHTIWLTTSERRAIYFSKGAVPMPLPKLGPKKFVVKPTDNGMGYGVFATQNLKRGETFHVERPFLVFPGKYMAFFGGGIPESAAKEITAREIMQAQLDHVERFLTVSFATCMTKEDRAEFRTLTNSYKDGSGPLGGIVRTNGIVLDFGEANNDFGGWYAAVGRVGSRFNHSCVPDVAVDFDPTTFAMQYTAVRDIEAGSQIFHCYTQPYETKAQRAQSLQEYGIYNCSCPTCLRHRPYSDRLRPALPKLINGWFDQANNVWVHDPNLKVDVLKPVLEIKRWMDEHGMDIEACGYHTILGVMMIAYLRLGMEKEAAECQAGIKLRYRGNRELMDWFWEAESLD